MSVKLKTKIALGGVFLFTLLALVGFITSYYFNQLSSETKEIVKDNYETLNYARDMIGALDEMHTDSSQSAIKTFEQRLFLQENNLTEPGERGLTASLRAELEKIKTSGYSEASALRIRQLISGIMEVNLQAIDRKNKSAIHSTEKAKTTIMLMLSACLLAGLVFIFNFPMLVASPLSKLTEGIKAIAEKNYDQRIHLTRNDEFGELANAFNSMAEKLDEYEHSNLSRILFEKQRAEAVINILKDASIGIDQKGIILFANEQALQLLNLKNADLVGQPAEQISKANDLFRFILLQPGTIPFRIVVDGKENYFTREVIDLTLDKEKSGTIYILKNITPFKELDVAKTNFLATISHELKTPLASSDFGLKLLENEKTGSLSPEQKELVQQLKEDNQRMLKILSELLNMSQVEAGRIELNIQAGDPLSIIDKAIEAIDSTAQQKKIAIQKNIGPVTQAVYCDKEKAGWVLNNLLSNAIKYAPEESVVTVSLSQQTNSLLFSVEDRGNGIPEEYQQKIFNRYFKIPGTVAKGTGLGLAISKDFVEQMNGRIGVSSSPGKGSRFYFELPFANI